MSIFATPDLGDLPRFMVTDKTLARVNAAWAANFEPPSPPPPRLERVRRGDPRGRNREVISGGTLSILAERAT